MDSKSLAYGVLRQGGYWMINKELVKTLGLVEANVLSYLIDKSNAHGDWFYCIAEYIYKELNIGRRPYDSALANLKNNGFVETKLAGVPPRVHFHINYNLVLDSISNSIEQSNLCKTDKSICSESTSNKELINKELKLFPLSVSTDIPQGEGCCVVEEYSKEEQLFEEFRRAYGGTKRGHSKEFENFKKKYRDWRSIAKLLMPAYQSQKQYREESIKQGCFVPQEQNLQTWINNEGWTYELSFQKDSRAIQQQQSINDDMRGIEEKYQESKRRNSIMQNLYDAGNF